ncbi:hypothetical protein K438DRAFT_1756648 [Mycena galopus ATCC 62051]|nr:hypothetical protein K438DRAFT_1756648 [Mycena galopus ATCC 62051]
MLPKPSTRAWPGVGRSQGLKYDMGEGTQGRGESESESGVGVRAASPGSRCVNSECRVSTRMVSRSSQRAPPTLLSISPSRCRRAEREETEVGILCPSSAARGPGSERHSRTEGERSGTPYVRFIPSPGSAGAQHEKQSERGRDEVWPVSPRQNRHQSRCIGMGMVNGHLAQGTGMAGAVELKVNGEARDGDGEAKTDIGSERFWNFKVEESKLVLR